MSVGAASMLSCVCCFAGAIWYAIYCFQEYVWWVDSYPVHRFDPKELKMRNTSFVSSAPREFIVEGWTPPEPTKPDFMVIWMRYIFENGKFYKPDGSGEALSKKEECEQLFSGIKAYHSCTVAEDGTACNWVGEQEVKLTIDCRVVDPHSEMWNDIAPVTRINATYATITGCDGCKFEGKTAPIGRYRVVSTAEGRFGAGVFWEWRSTYIFRELENIHYAGQHGWAYVLSYLMVWPILLTLLCAGCCARDCFYSSDQDDFDDDNMELPIAD